MIRIAALVFFVLGSTQGLAAAALAPQKSKAQDPVMQALAALKAGEFDQVFELADQVTEENEAWPRMTYVVAEARYLQGDMPGATSAFRAVLEKRPEAVPALVGLGRSLTRTKDREQAETALRRALELEPKDVQAQAALAQLLADSEMGTEALELARAAYKTDKRDGEAVRALVLVLLRADEKVEAHKVATQLANTQRKHPLGPFLLGVVYERQGQDSRALSEYQRALERDEKYLDAHKNLGILCHTLSNTYQDQHRVDLAFKHYARYLELGGKDPELENAYRMMKKYLRPDDGDK